ncbi:hypothetical protein FHR84_000883 [Actinopolyspora biskrensis]|uniref:Uncharacterized protein n=1 Tax=Actinopolyspora biskrensis TaxID=1470178 RepID=A0A852YVH6_9ACTN|nr:hypothetical protein [Actinopolyspora biskrensis]NYH77569.1 hypothetical protein [Actinopolyspora biskrensis]
MKLLIKDIETAVNSNHLPNRRAEVIGEQCDAPRRILGFEQSPLDGTALEKLTKLIIHDACGRVGTHGGQRDRISHDPVLCGDSRHMPTERIERGLGRRVRRDTSYRVSSGTRNIDYPPLSPFSHDRQHVLGQEVRAGQLATHLADEITPGEREQRFERWIHCVRVADERVYAAMFTVQSIHHFFHVLRITDISLRGFR